MTDTWQERFRKLYWDTTDCKNLEIFISLELLSERQRIYEEIWSLPIKRVEREMFISRTAALHAIDPTQKTK